MAQIRKNPGSLKDLDPAWAQQSAASEPSTMCLAQEAFWDVECHPRLAPALGKPVWMAVLGLRNPGSFRSQLHLLPVSKVSDVFLAFSNFGVNVRKMQNNTWQELGPDPGLESNLAIINRA